MNINGHVPEHWPRARPRRRADTPSAIERVLLAGTTGVTLMVEFGLVLARGLVVATVVIGALAVFSVCFSLLAWGHPTAASRRLACVLLMGTLMLGALEMVPSSSPGLSAQPPPTTPARPPESVGPSVPLGAHARALTVGPDGLLAIVDRNLMAYDPSAPTDTPRTLPIDGPIFALAANGSRLVVSYGGSLRGAAAVFDSRTYRLVRPAFHSGEEPGRVALGFDAAWVCNVTHAKLDRLDLRTGRLTEISVPGTPNDVLAADGFVWVTVDGGWLERVNPLTGAARRFRTQQDDPEAMAAGAGAIWISHPENRVVTRVDPRDGTKVGPPIRVGADVTAMRVFHGALFVVSSGTDALQRLDPRTSRVVSTIPLPREPSGIAALGGRLWVTSELAGTTVPVTVRPIRSHARRRRR